MVPNMQKTLTANSINLLESHRKTLRAIHDVLKRAESVLIGTHEHPDGDAIGSALALLAALRLQGKRVTAYIPDPAPEMFSFLPGFEKLTTEKPDPRSYDVVVLLDYTKIYRTHLADEVKRHEHTICIYHHH